MKYIVVSSSYFFEFTRMYSFWYYLYDIERIAKKLNSTGQAGIYYVLRPKLRYLSLTSEGKDFISGYNLSSVDPCFSK